MGLHSYRVDADIRSAAAGHLLEQLDEILGVLVVDDLRLAHVAREGEPLREPVDRDDAIGSLQVGALDGEVADRAATPHRHGVAGLDLASFRRLPSGGQDVRKEQHLLVAHAIRNLDRPQVGVGHSRVFRLTTGLPAEHVRVAEDAGSGRSPVERFEHFRIRI